MGLLTGTLYYHEPVRESVIGIASTHSMTGAAHDVVEDCLLYTSDAADE